MRKRRKLLIALSCTLLLALALPVLLREREPTYKGKSLTQWAQQLDGDPPRQQYEEAATAIRALCSNAIPSLVSDLNYDGTPRWDTLYSRLRWLPSSLRDPVRTTLLADQKQLRAWRASLALQALGQDAAPAIPQLIVLLNSTNRAVSYRAMWILDHMGNPGLVAMLKGMSDPASPLRSDLVPIIDYTANLGTNAAPAVPTLLRCAQDADPSVRQHATKALQAIAPEALATAPPQ